MNARKKITVAVAMAGLVLGTGGAAYAAGANNAPAPQVSVVRVSAESNTTNAVVVACPPGHPYLIGGGYANPAGGPVWFSGPYVNTPYWWYGGPNADNAWMVLAGNNAFGDPSPYLTAFAFCQK